MWSEAASEALCHRAHRILYTEQEQFMELFLKVIDVENKHSICCTCISIYAISKCGLQPYIKMSGLLLRPLYM